MDSRTHYLTGYNIFMNGIADGKERQFAVAISEKQQIKCELRIGDFITGTAWTKKYPEIEYANYYRADSLKKAAAEETIHTDKVPWIGLLPDFL